MVQEWIIQVSFNGSDKEQVESWVEKPSKLGICVNVELMNILQRYQINSSPIASCGDCFGPWNINIYFRYSHFWKMYI